MNPTYPIKVAQRVWVSLPDSRFLILLRSATDNANPGLWDFPGGKLDVGEDIEQGAMRELYEESGISVNEIKIAAVKSNTNQETGQYWVSLLYMASTADEAVALSDEHDDYKWVTKEDFLSLDTTNNAADFFEKITKG